MSNLPWGIDKPQGCQKIYKTVSRRPSSAVTAFHCTFAMMGNLATKAAPSTLVRARKAWGPNEISKTSRYIFKTKYS